MKERYRDELKWWEKMLGVWRVNRDSYDTHWGYFAPRWALEFKFHKGGYFSNQCSLDVGIIWGLFHIKLPIRLKDYKEDCEWLEYGFMWFENQWVFKWGEWSKWWDVPFISWVFDYHRVMHKDGHWVNGDQAWKNEEIEKEIFDYTYVLESGEVQHRKATCYRECRQWHRKWLPFIKMRRVAISIEFDDEVGERSGTWKGGTIGCGWDMLPNETIEQCLRRMEKERKFT
ncbi:hypothetical protein KF4_079 [Vibrio phage vB_VpaS_KF4]|nr:hypothetical protein KF3_045 [Vibrio phage vB_VpaS_KF3]ATI19292.1 hypothetical protein KF4_079 [Vibrio phage vB_VpaS_KF4]